MSNRGKKIIILNAVLVFCGALSGPAYAYQIGRTDIGLRAAFKENYDDNITFVKDNKKEGSSNILSLGLYADYEDKRNVLKLDGNVYHQIYNSHRKYNNTSEDFSLDFSSDISKRQRISIKDNFLHAYEPRSFEQEFGRIGGRYGYYQNRLDFGYQLDLSRRLIAKAKYVNTLDNFNTSDLSDSYLNKGTVAFEYALGELLTFLSSYDFSYRDFSPGGSATANTLSSGLRKFLNKRTYIELQGGVDFIESTFSSDYTKPRYSVALSNEVDKDSTAIVAFLREYSTNPYAQDIFDFYQATANFKRQLSKKISCSLTGLWGRGKYLILDITDRFIGGRLDLVFEPKEGMRFTLGYDYSRADSNVSEREYKRNLYSIGMAMEF